MGVLIRNGEIVTASDRYIADVQCDDLPTPAFQNQPDPPLVLFLADE